MRATRVLQEELCSASKCTFVVSATTGVLSRTGGSQCGDPGCQFLSLAGLSFTSIAPGTFEGMSYLTVLDLSNNQLANITHNDLEDLTALKTLALNHNRLTSIAEGTFAGLSAVETLGLGNNWLGPGSISGGSFEGLSGVLSLNLALQRDGPNSGIRDIGDGAFRHMPLLRELKMKRSLRAVSGSEVVIGNNTFSGGLVHLETLDLSENYDYGNMRLAPGAFRDLPGLKILDLRSNYLPQEDFEPGLFRNCRNLTELNLFDNRITTLSEDIFAGLGDSLVRLHLSRNRIDSVSMAAFSGISKLSYLDLSDNRLSVVPLDFVNVTSAPPSTWKYIYLGYNPLVCAPRRPPSNYYVSLSLPSGSDAMPLCPTEVTFLPASDLSLSVCSANFTAKH
jgi:Leucine-rich repeat (LRR) protein